MVPSVLKRFVCLGGIIVLIAGVALLGYFTDHPFLYYVIENISEGMALHTAILFVLLGLGLSFMGLSQASQRKNFGGTSIKNRLIICFLLTAGPAFFAMSVGFYKAEQVMQAIQIQQWLAIWAWQ